MMQPVSRIDLSNSKSTRNFWVYINAKKVWSATGVSKDLEAIKNDSFQLEAGLLWQKVTRANKKIGLKAEITSFCPASAEPVEIMLVKLTNTSTKPIKFIPTASIPIYARSSNNLRDHRHVTSLLNRIELDKSGVVVTPTLLFDETGHKKNHNSYFVFGINEESAAPEYIYPTQEEFTGENSDLEAPAAIYENILPDKKFPLQGKEALAGLRFPTKTLKAKKSTSYIIVMGISDNKTKIKSFFSAFDSVKKVTDSLAMTREYWQKRSNQIKIDSANHDFDNWLHWVNIQPILRKIFGCSFLPDFDYGKGGRGWRDLWQDCLALILTEPEEARGLLINNFKGVRMDGSNATIIGAKPGEFIADRNNISRVWMDHGVWPLLTTLFYIHQSSDIDILLEDIPYFKDCQVNRGSEKDFTWAPDYGKEHKTKMHHIYKGSVLEHILVETLVQFFNAGPHNFIRLENADWNDGLDMAAGSGESIAFSAMYAQNLRDIALLIEKLKKENISVFKEISVLLDTLGGNPLDYSNIQARRDTLEAYFKATRYEISGEKINIPSSGLIADLDKKAAALEKDIRDHEWLDAGFFNGYYNNDKERVEGKINSDIRMTLTSQAMAVMSGVASKDQIKILFKNVKKYLQDEKLKGFCLNTDLKDEQLNLGRAFSFVYGDKENGAFFNHMSVIFSYALYSRGFAQEGFEVLNSIVNMSLDTETNKIFPCLPEYFNAAGRGMYSYLTGSASWFIYTLLTQAFGIRGSFGDLLIEPKLNTEQFKKNGTLSISTIFAKRPIEVKFINPRLKDFGSYQIKKILFNQKTLLDKTYPARFLLKRQNFLELANQQNNIIEVHLS